MSPWSLRLDECPAWLYFGMPLCTRDEIDTSGLSLQVFFLLDWDINRPISAVVFHGNFMLFLPFPCIALPYSVNCCYYFCIMH